MLDGTVASAVTHRAASACRYGRMLFAPFAAGAMPALAAALPGDRETGVHAGGARWIPTAATAATSTAATAATALPGVGDWWLFALILRARLIGVAQPGSTGSQPSRRRGPANTHRGRWRRPVSCRRWCC